MIILEEIEFLKIKELLLAQKDDYGEIFLVGGYVRDAILKKPSKDLDFVVTKNAAKAARCIADKFCGDYYLLDRQRETARALVTLNGQQLIVDTAIMNGEKIEDDLKKRDFSINAMAINLLEPNHLIDPLCGKKDLEQQRLKPCSEKSFLDDPIRTLRAIRFIQSLSLNYDSHVGQAIISASHDLNNISGERIHYELSQIFIIKDVMQSLNLMVEFGLLKILFPELELLRKISPRSPHVADAFTHTLKVIELTRFFLENISGITNNAQSELISDVLSLVKVYKIQLAKFLEDLAGGHLSIYFLTVIAALYHDSGKAFINPDEVNGNTLFPGHAEKSAEIARVRMKVLTFSNDEIHFVRSVIRFHMSDELKTIGAAENSERDIYRFFQKTGKTGIVIAFLHLADIIATYEGTLKPERWSVALKSVKKILDGWFNHFDEVVAPPRLLNGDDLIEIYKIKPGQELGQILEQISGEQAAGTIKDRNAAFALAEKLIFRK